MSMVWKKNNHNPSSKQDCREHNLNKYILLLNTGNCICPNYIASIYFSWQLLNNFKNRRVFIKVLFQINLSEVLCGMEVKINWYLFIIGCTGTSYLFSFISWARFCWYNDQKNYCRRVSQAPCCKWII